MHTLNKDLNKTCSTETKSPCILFLTNNYQVEKAGEGQSEIKTKTKEPNSNLTISACDTIVNITKILRVILLSRCEFTYGTFGQSGECGDIFWVVLFKYKNKFFHIKLLD